VFTCCSCLTLDSISCHLPMSCTDVVYCCCCCCHQGVLLLQLLQMRQAEARGLARIVAAAMRQRSKHGIVGAVLYPRTKKG
jgi:hypothetical protein